MAARIKGVYQDTLDKITAYCDRKGKDQFRAPDIGLPHGHARALSTRGKIKKVSRRDGVTEWALIRNAYV